MSNIGALATIGWTKETTFATPLAATRFWRYSSQSIKESIAQLQEVQLRGVLDEPDNFPGIITIGGDISGPAHSDILGDLMLSVFGAKSTSGTGPFVHFFSPQNGALDALRPVPSYTMQISRDLDVLQLAGAVVSKLTLKMAKGGLMTVSASILGQKAIVLGSPAAAVFGTSQPFWYLNAAITRNAVAYADVEEFTVTIENQFDAVPTIDGTQYINRIKWNGMRKVSVSFTADYATTQLYNDFKAQITQPWSIVAKGNNPATDTLTLSFPNILWTDAQPSVSGAGRITVSASGLAKLNASSFAFTASLTNGIATY